MMKIQIGIFACLLFTSCIMGANANRVEVTKGPVLAKGSTSLETGDILEWIEIDLRQTDDESSIKLTIRIDGERMDLASLSREFLLTQGADSWEGESKKFGGTETFYIEGYALRFDEEQLIGLRANRYGFPPTSEEVGPEIGLIDSEEMLVLPCSLSEFEAVFGKADDVKRGFRW